MSGREKERRLKPQGMTANFKQFWHLWGLAGKVPVLWMKNLMCDWECGTLVTDALFSIPVKMGPIGCLENMSLGTNREPAVVYSLTIKTPRKFYLMSNALQIMLQPVWAANPCKLRKLDVFLGFLFLAGLEPNTMMQNREHLCLCSHIASATPLPPMLSQLWKNCLEHKT